MKQQVLIGLVLMTATACGRVSSPGPVTPTPVPPSPAPSATPTVVATQALEDAERRSPSDFTIAYFFQNGSGVRTEFREWLGRTGFVHWAYLPVLWDGRDSTKVRIRVQVPDFAPYNVPLAMSVRYGCKEQARGEAETFPLSGLLDRTAQRDAWGRRFYEGEILGLSSVQNYCAPLPVAVKFELTTFPGFRPMASFVSYLRVE